MRFPGRTEEEYSVRMTKISPLVLAGFVTLLLPLHAFASFPDVSSTHANYDAIAYVQAQEIVSGYPDGTYHPDATINRAEFVKIIVSAVSEGGTDCAMSWLSTGKPFTDVKIEDWFSGYVCEAQWKGLVSGYSDKTFRPANTINFVEAAKIVTKAFDVPVMTDENIWYKGYVDALAAKNAIPSTIWGMDAKLTRGEMAEMIYRLRIGESASSSSSASSTDFCRDTFVKTRSCPEDQCEIGCGGGGGGFGCAMACNPKDCQSFDAVSCPSDRCKLMTNCDGQQTCFYKLSGQPPACGGPTYYGQDVQCCSGLEKRCGAPHTDGSCNMSVGDGEFPQCIRCGSGICDAKYENRCNCPEDCK